MHIHGEKIFLIVADAYCCESFVCKKCPFCLSVKRKRMRSPIRFFVLKVKKIDLFTRGRIFLSVAEWLEYPRATNLRNPIHRDGANEHLHVKVK